MQWVILAVEREPIFRPHIEAIGIIMPKLRLKQEESKTIRPNPDNAKTNIV